MLRQIILVFHLFNLVNTFYDLFRHKCMSPVSTDSHMKLNKLTMSQVGMVGLKGFVAAHVNWKISQNYFSLAEKLKNLFLLPLS